MKKAERIMSKLNRIRNMEMKKINNNPSTKNLSSQVKRRIAIERADMRFGFTPMQKKKSRKEKNIINRGEFGSFGVTLRRNRTKFDVMRDERKRGFVR